jgi:peptidyl-prolyl cis-trans isomerase C
METVTMELRVNGIVVPEEAIRREAAEFAGAPDPETAARRALAVRELLLQRAGELGWLEDGAPRERVTFASRADEDALIARVLDTEVVTPQPGEDECRRVYDQDPERYTSGELVEASHILFAVTPGVPVAALRTEAERVLVDLVKSPQRLGERAKEISNCPSGQQGGNLGQFGRGQMVPEFDAAVFGNDRVGVLPQLVATRYGFHVVRVDHRVAGRTLPFETVRERIARELSTNVEARALRQYVEVLAGRADVHGADLAAAATPLVQ